MMHNTHEVRRFQLLGLLFIPFLLPVLVGCESKEPTGEVKKEAPMAEAKKDMPADEAKTETPADSDAPLVAPVSSLGRPDNDEGISHAQQSHWDVAEGYFRKAIEADPKLAEAQFNLGLTLDKLGKHDEAKDAFTKAAQLAPGNTKITESPILMKHTST